MSVEATMSTAVPGKNGIESSTTSTTEMLPHTSKGIIYISYYILYSSKHYIDIFVVDYLVLYVTFFVVQGGSR